MGSPGTGGMTETSTQEQQQQHQQTTPQLSSLYGLSVGAAVCMADLVRQVSGFNVEACFITFVSSRF
jgi:hypothetical protein